MAIVPHLYAARDPFVGIPLDRETSCLEAAAESVERGVAAPFSPSFDLLVGKAADTGGEHEGLSLDRELERGAIPSALAVPFQNRNPRDVWYGVGSAVNRRSR